MKFTRERFKKILDDYYSRSPPCKFAIGVDFDGTLCYSHYPYGGEPTPFCQWLKEMQHDPELDFKTVIVTCRDDKYSNEYAEEYAKEWLSFQGVHYDAFNENLQERIDIFSDCRKIFCNLYIDDTNYNFDMEDFT